MRKKQEDRLAMCGRMAAFIAENNAALGASPVAQEQADTVTNLYGQLAGARSRTARRTKALTLDSKTARVRVLELLPALLGPLARVASRLGEHDLLAAVTLSNKQLRKLRPLAFIGVVQAVLGSAARPNVAPELARQGLSAAALQPLRAALTEFQRAQPAPRQTIDARVVSGAALEDLLGELMVEVRELDEDMKAFKLLDRELYEGYVQSRKIVDSPTPGPSPAGRGA